jgi:ribose 5-phosphate isomerase B
MVLLSCRLKKITFVDNFWLILANFIKKTMIPIGCDHAGFQTKQAIIQHLTSKGYEVKDYGCFSEESIDYPDYAHPVAEHIEKNPGTLGILLCGSGNGISMTANKHQEIRSALCWKKEIAELARQHNDANIITLPARFISIEEAIEMVDTFLNTPFEGGRHAKRVSKIPC